MMDDEYLDYYYLKDIIKIKGLFTENGIYPIVLKKRNSIINNKLKEDFYFELDETLVNDFDYNINKIKDPITNYKQVENIEGAGVKIKLKLN